MRQRIQQFLRYSLTPALAATLLFASVPSPAKVSCESGYASVPRAERMEAAAEKAGLHYLFTSSRGPGIKRLKLGKKYAYYTPSGKRITSESEIARINALQIPPGYHDIWISPDPDSHIQALAKDAKNRGQYRYHPKWIAFQKEEKFSRMQEFGESLPQIRAHVRANLAAESAEGTLAAIVRTLDETGIRIGNEEYAKTNSTYGLTTLRKSHVKVEGNSVTFTFRGKSSKDHSISVADAALARKIRALLRLPGRNLFQAPKAGGGYRAVSSGEVNDYLKTIGNGQFTAKDFRTWSGTVTAAQALLKAGGKGEVNIKAAIQAASEKLGNTPSIAEKSYIHPAVLEEYRKENPLFRGSRDPEELVIELISRH